MRHWWKTEEVVRDARFPPNFCHNMPLPWQHTFYTVQKCVLHIYTQRQTSVPNFILELVKNWGSSSRRQIFPPSFAIICRYHGNTLSTTFTKCVLHIYNPKANICAKFHENWWKTEEVVRDARFFPNFCHNMPLPWQHTFYHCQKMCLAHLHPKANICANFMRIGEKLRK